jgi:hypothetical protein
VNPLRQTLDRLVRTDLPAPERQRLVELMELFAFLPPPPDPVGLYPDYESLKAAFLDAATSGDTESLDEAFLSLYCHVHGHEAPYTPEERARVNQTGGYWCHAGGLSPILKAGAHIRPGTVSGDFGAGNGLQTLLMMKLYPHEKTRLIEISSRMVEAGRALMAWLGIDEARVDWMTGDVLDASPRGMDFIYLYRPVKPDGQAGQAFYRRFARELEEQNRPVVIFSIADCLRPFLPASFETFYTDGHLTCYRSGVKSP